MAVLKILASVALLGTVARCQDIYSAYNPRAASGSSGIGQYSPSILSRGTPRLVPVKVRASSSRFFPSYFYPGPPPPPPPHYHHHHQHSPASLSPIQTHASSYPSHLSHHHAHAAPTFPRHFQQYRTAMTGYYRPTRQSSSSYFSNPYHESGQHVQYHTAATSSPVVLKRGRVLSAPSPYTLESPSASSSSSGGLQYAQNFPDVSRYRPSQPQQQISSSPIHHQQHQSQLQAQQQYQQQQYQQQQQQPTYYIQKGPVVVGPGRPVKISKAKKQILQQQSIDDAVAEEEYPSDPNPQYNFSFDIKDDELTNYQNRQEERDGQTIKGSYSVVDPDGYVRTVTYTADPKNGFQAKVTREPTDVKIKFPVPTQAPEATEQRGQQAGPLSRGQTYQPQYQTQTQYQPQYQAGSYATPQQVYASAEQPQVQVQPRYVPRTASRFAIQPQASSPRARIIRRVRRPSPPTPTEQQESEQE